MVANAKQDCVTLLKGEEAAVSMLEGLNSNIKDPILAMLSSVEPQNHSEDRKRAGKGRQRVMFEFCCSPESSLGKVHEEKETLHFRLTKKPNDLSDPEEAASLQKMIDQFPGATLWGSLPCGPWSKWQAANIARYGKEYAKWLKKDRKLSRKLLKDFLETAENVLCQGGHIAFEWPKGAKGGQPPELTAAFVKKHGLYIAECHGCFFGLKSSNGNPMFKPWHIATFNYRLASNLNKCRCQHLPGFHHDRAKGSETPKTAFYPEAMARTISECLYPEHAYSMPVIAEKDSDSKTRDCKSHSKKVWGMASKLKNKSSYEPNLQDKDSVYAGIHLLLDRKDWRNHPGWKEAIDKELNGILENGTWNCDEVISREELMSKKEPTHVGRLMTILSVKHWENEELRRLKARIVSRGDDIRDENNNLAVLQEAKVNPSGLAGINANLAYCSLKGHTSSQSEAVRAYAQSFLNTKVPTWVELPYEVVPPEYRSVKRPCVRLWKSSYGHPEAGYHWDQRFKQMMKEIGSIHCSDTFQSTYFMKDTGLLLTLYVDDMILSGPENQCKLFWDKVKQHTEVENPAPVDRILGRNHKVNRNQNGTTMQFSMSDFAENACKAYEELSGCKLKTASTPFHPDGSLVDSDFETRGHMASDASKVLMKILWSARLSRPDLMKAISDLTRRITTWSKADDRRLFRLMSYLKGTADYVLEGRIQDDAKALRLCLYTDADRASGFDDVKSTSGMILALVGPNSLWPLCWGSKRQGATARSTCDAEMISLDSGVFGEGLPTQELFETILNRPVEPFCQQDNASVIQIVHGGYSPKPRRMKKVHKLNLSSLYEVFEDPSVKLQYIKTALQRAGPFTKALEPCKSSNALPLNHPEFHPIKLELCNQLRNARRGRRIKYHHVP